MADPDAPASVDFTELGRTGLLAWGGYVYEDFRQELQGLRALRVYKEMRMNDPVVGAVLYAFEQLMGQVAWRVTPASSDPEDARLAAFVDSALHDMSATWRDTVGEALSMLPYGWSWLEVVFKRRQGDVADPARRSQYTDGAIGWRKWAPRSQDSWDRWAFDASGGIQALVQRPAPDYQVRELPIDRSLLFRTRALRGNPEGQSLLRNAWRPWVFVRRLQEILGIGIERNLAGLPVITPPEGVDLWNPTDPKAAQLRAQAEKIVRNIRLDQHMGVVKPFGWSLELLGTAGQGRNTSNVVEALKYFDTRIAMTVLGDFILIGHEEQSRSSMALSKTQLFTAAAGAYLDRVADVVNRYAIPSLLRANGWTPTAMPTLTHGDVDAPDLRELGEYITKLAGAGAPLFPDRALEVALRQAARLPEPPVDEEGREPDGREDRVVVALQDLEAQLQTLAATVRPGRG
jgi:hypothetical protein